MPHVPGASRTRASHRRAGRPSHQHTGYLPALSGASEVYEQVGIDGVVGEQNLLAGSLQPSRFPADARPVVVLGALPTLPDNGYPLGATVVLLPGGTVYRNVAGAWTASVGALGGGIEPLGSLPTLPDAAYPNGAVVFLTTDDKLYRNDDGVWSRAVDGADLIADTVTTNAIAAGAITAAEIAAGAVTADKLLVGGGRYLTNPDFETGTFEGWTFAPASGGSSGIGGDPAWRAQGLYYATIANGGSIGSELYQWVYGLKQGDVISLSALLANSNVVIAIGWYDKDGVNISYDMSAEFWPGGGYGGSGPTRWTHVTAPAPVGTTTARIIFVNKTASTALLIDDVWLSRVGDLATRDGNVLINSGGITIKNGKLTFQDSFGSTVLTGAGFSENWEDFLATGLYNGTFLRSNASADTSDYWAHTVGTYPLEVVAKAAATSGFAWRYTPNGAAAGSSSYLQSALVPVTGRMGYEVIAIVDHNFISGTPNLAILLRAEWYKANLTACSPAYSEGQYNLTNADTAGTARSGRLVAPPDARFAVVYAFMFNGGNGNCQTDIESMALVRSLTTDYFVPPGVIMLWSGQTTTIPNGWYLCDGANGTPDLRDRFIVGADSTNEGTSGGTVSPTAALAHASSGGGGATTGANVSGSLNGAAGADWQRVHTHDIPNHAHSSHAIPNFYRLCYIMKG